MAITLAFILPILAFSSDGENTGFLVLVALFVALGPLYVMIFSCVIIRGIPKIFSFLKYRYVVYIPKKLILHDTIFSSEKKARPLLSKLADMFGEPLGQSSWIRTLTHKTKNTLINTTSQHVFEGMKNTPHNPTLIMWTLGSINAVFYAIYTIGQVGIFVISCVFYVVVKIILFFYRHTFSQIYTTFLALESRTQKMHHYAFLIQKDAEKFLSTISSHALDHIPKHIEKFYASMTRIEKIHKKLSHLLRKKDLQDALDTSIFDAYLRKQFNTPLFSLISILEDSHDKISTLKSEQHTATSAHIQLSLERLQIQDEILLSHIQKLKKMLIA